MSNEPRPRDPLRCFTFAGRLLFICALLAGGGLFALVVLYGLDHVPAGSYPIAFLLIPVVIGVAMFFLIVELVLRLFGIRIWAETKDAELQPGAAPHGAAATPSGGSGPGEEPPAVN